MRLAHVSDLHLLPPGGISPGKGTSPEDLARAVADDLASISAGIDLVVISGDLTEKADAASFGAFEEIFAAIGLPVVIVPGNHDGPAGFHGYAQTSRTFAGWNITNRTVDIAEFRFLGLDTCIERTTEGALDDAGLALVEQELARDSDSRLVIVMHHPPLVLGLAQFDGFCRLENGERLLQMLQSASSPTIVLSGHVHRPYTARQGNISCFVAGSMIAPYDSPLPFGETPIRPAEMQDFYYIHDLGTDGRHIVTPQRVRGLRP